MLAILDSGARVAIATQKNIWELWEKIAMRNTRIIRRNMDLFLGLLVLEREWHSANDKEASVNGEIRQFSI